MLTVAIAIAVGLAGWFVGELALESAGWAVFLAAVGFFVTWILLNLWNRKRLQKVFQSVQEEIERDQGALKRQLAQMQNHAGGATRGAQKQLEKKQREGIRRAIERLDEVKRLQKWNFLAERQANTMRAQLHFQMGEFEEADAYLRKSFSMDPLTHAIKMARAYKHEDDKAVEKLFRRGVKRFKGDSGTLIWALYSWILVKQNRVDEAVKVLANAKEKCDSDAIRSNWEHLVNGRVKRFSNAALGDQWYALQLETPKQKRVKQGRSAGKRRFR